jgi:hypothetical protein
MGFKSPEKSYFKAFYIIAPGVFCSFWTPWILFLVSLHFNFKVPSSGAVLVCGALLCEMFFEALHWRKFLELNFKGSILIKAEDNSFHKRISKSALQNIGTKKEQYLGLMSFRRGTISSTHSLTDNEEDYLSTAFPDEWFYYRDVVFAERWLRAAIVFNAVIGTLLWGYGDLIWVSE